MEQSNSNMRHPSSHKNSDKISKSNSGPVVLLLWVWNWFATLPKTVSNLYVDLKNGELLSKFSMVDAMFQFIFAVATSCHPQEDGFDDEPKVEKPASLKKDLKVFGGSGRTLRSRVIEAES